MRTCQDWLSVVLEASKTHRDHIDKIGKTVIILVESYSPKCSPWSASTAMKEASKLEAPLQAEHPNLQWLAQRVKRFIETVKPALSRTPGARPSSRARRSSAFRILAAMDIVISASLEPWLHRQVLPSRSQRYCTRSTSS